MKDSSITSYYEQNTHKFRLTSRKSAWMHIHQPLYTSQQDSYSQAVLYTPALIRNLILDHASENKKITDLGCGVGGTLAYLAESLPAEMVELKGVTISPKQAQQAEQSWNDLEADPPPQIIVADYHHLSAHLEKQQVIYAIESMVHAHDASRVMQEVSESLVDGGVFVMVDDFLTSSPAPKDHRHIRQYQNGWMAPALFTREEWNTLAQEANLQMESFDDLTSLMRFPTFRKWVIQLTVSLFGWLSPRSLYIRSLVGGHHKRMAIRKGWIRYGIAVFRKS